MTLASRGYVANADDITHIAVQLMRAASIDLDERLTYLRALAATTLAELGVKPRQNAAAKAARLKPDEVAVHLKALETVHDRFYEIILKVVSDKLPAGKEKARELNRRTNFARTALSAVRGFVRAGRDITKVPIGKLTKRALAVERTVRPISAGRLKRRVEAQSKALVASLLDLGQTDKATAVGELQLLMNQLASQLVELGGKPVSNAVLASDTHVPLRSHGRVFVPVTQSQVLRQQARPS